MQTNFQNRKPPPTPQPATTMAKKIERHKTKAEEKKFTYHLPGVNCRVTAPRSQQ